MKYILIAVIFSIGFMYGESTFAYDYSNSTIQKENAYGLGVHMDQYGRAVTIQPKNNHTGYTNPLLEINENQYGYQNHADQYGRPVTIQPYGKYQ